MPEQYAEALDFFNKHYIPNEPTRKGLGCGKQSDKFDEVVLNFFEDNLSWCALEESTGEMIGLRINQHESIDNLPDVLPTFEQYVKSGWSKELSSILVLLDDVFNAKEIMRQYKETKMLVLWALCVHSAHGKKGIGGELVRRALIHGKDCAGYSLAGVVCTNSFGKNIFEKMEFEKVKEIKYSSYTVEGKYLFRNIDKLHQSISTYVKRL